MSEILSKSQSAPAADQIEWARLTGLFVGPMVMVAAISHLYNSWSPAALATLVGTILIFWLPINPISVPNAIAVLRAQDYGRERALRLAVSWGGVLLAIAIKHADFAMALSNLHKLL